MPLFQFRMRQILYILNNESRNNKNMKQQRKEGIKTSDTNVTKRIDKIKDQIPTATQKPHQSSACFETQKLPDPVHGAVFSN